ncbi:hypothetical protein A6C57_01290 [Fibrella sp. ES10-3-2-2]|nr:hypothetical protein A6C57_01290 [Fibrella sp. ES10-3-2-2]
MNNALRGPNIAISAMAQILSIGGEPLLWTSESDFALGTIALDRYTVAKWKKETVDGQAAHPFKAIRNQMAGMAPADFLVNEPWLFDTKSLGKYLLLDDIFNNTGSRECAVFKRPTNEPSVFELYLLIRFPGEWVGLKTLVVET